MSYYILLSTADGSWVPNTSQRSKTSAELTKSMPPRLFTSYQSAAIALEWWLEGVWAKRWDTQAGEYDVVSFPKPHRQEAGMEVAKVKLIIEGDSQ